IRTEEWSLGVAAIVKELLPLPNHAKISVVDDRDVDIKFFLRSGGQLGHRHLEAPITCDDPNVGVRACELRSDRSGQCKSHRAQSTRGNERPRLFVLVVLRL